MINNTDKSDSSGNQGLKCGTLYVVATPIGNLKDITLRAIETLKEADLILCENTFNSQKLLSNFAITTKTWQFTDFTNEKQIHNIIKLLHEGKNVCLISDAGTPLVSDPGYKLVRTLREHNITVTPIPGASTITALVSVSPIPINNFYFHGFLPNTTSHLQRELKALSDLPCALIFFESPKRILATLHSVIEMLGDRDVFVARELTKLHEQFYYGSASNVIEQIQNSTLKGEIAFIVSGVKSVDTITDEALATLVETMLKTSSIKDVAAELSKEYHLHKKKVYDLALKLKK